MKKEIEKLKRQRTSLIKSIDGCQDALQGSLIRIYRMCRNKNCPCRGERRSIHGASYYISTKESGRTHLLYVPEEKLNEARRRINQFKKLKNLLRQITKLNEETFRLKPKGLQVTKGASRVRKRKQAK